MQKLYSKKKIYYLLMFIAFFLICTLHAATISPSFELDLDLKKDEVVYASIQSSKDSQGSSDEKDFTLRWTLYRNEGLVVLVRYDKYPYQFILYKDYKLNGWTLNLLDTQGVNRSLNQPHIKIYFIGIDDPFNDEKTIAHLRIYGFGDVSFSRK
ncbi:hypothetical protein [Helicobacter didelphidarum]|uniref:hypothetical protein n=1 Tax=Helicobacter didelphidarum TaxID=2040648 RepID=UPI001FEBC808|nr:hypothetical protein [Helicobacter didelphidarum]